MPPKCETHNCWQRLLPDGRVDCPECERARARKRARPTGDFAGERECVTHTACACVLARMMALEGVLRELVTPASLGLVRAEEDWACGFCLRRGACVDEVEHTADCPVTRARVLLTP